MSKSKKKPSPPQKPAKKSGWERVLHAGITYGRGFQNTVISVLKSAAYWPVNRAIKLYRHFRPGKQPVSTVVAAPPAQTAASTPVPTPASAPSTAIPGTTPSPTLQHKRVVTQSQGKKITRGIGIATAVLLLVAGGLIFFGRNSEKDGSLISSPWLWATIATVVIVWIIGLSLYRSRSYNKTGPAPVVGPAQSTVVQQTLWQKTTSNKWLKWGMGGAIGLMLILLIIRNWDNLSAPHVVQAPVATGPQEIRRPLPIDRKWSPRVEVPLYYHLAAERIKGSTVAYQARTQTGKIYSYPCAPIDSTDEVRGRLTSLEFRTTGKCGDSTTLVLVFTPLK